MPTKFRSLRIEGFNPKRHDRSDFCCGVERLDNYLKLSAKKHHANDLTRVYVAVEDGKNAVLGYHAINVGVMSADDLAARPKAMPAHGQIPILFLGQVAVTQEAQGNAIGSILMHHVFEKAVTIADTAGCYAIVLDIMDDGDIDAIERRRQWYAEFGFQPFASNPSRLFISIAQVRLLTAS